MKTILLAATAALLTSTAFAADAVLIEPAPIAEVAPVGDWTGFYAGVQLGGAFGSDDGFFALDSNLDGSFGDDIPAFTNETGEFDNGFIGGVHAGYDWQFGNMVAGGLVDISAADIGDSQTGRSGTPADYTIVRELDYLATVRGRLGYAFSDRFLGYVTGGVAFGDVEESFVSNTAAIVSTRGGDGTDLGYAVGGGVEAKVTERVSLGFEYLYTNLGSSDYTVNLSGAPGTGPGNAFSTIAASTDARADDADFDFHTVQMKLSYRF